MTPSKFETWLEFEVSQLRPPTQGSGFWFSEPAYRISSYGLGNKVTILYVTGLQFKPSCGH